MGKDKAPRGSNDNNGASRPANGLDRLRGWIPLGLNSARQIIAANDLDQYELEREYGADPGDPPSYKRARAFREKYEALQKRMAWLAFQALTRD